MAVPKQRQSRSRTAKRRAQHAIARPHGGVCPECGAARLAHRVCSSCGSYAGRSIISPAELDQ